MSTSAAPNLDAEIGVFARVFTPGPPGQVAAQIATAGFVVTQLNLAVLGRPTLDADLSHDDAVEIAAAFAAQHVRIWGVSGTFNAIDPHRGQRIEATERCRALIARAPDLGAEVVTLCTGTRDPDNIWRAHPDNTSGAARDDLLDTLGALVPAAAAAGVRLGIEPEPGNVITGADAARWLLDTLGADARHLAIVLDPANLLSVQTAPDQHAILEHAFEVLGPDTAAVHAKDVVVSGYAAPGVGALDYPLVMHLHATLPHRVPVIAQDLTEGDAPRVAAFLHLHAQRQTAP
ncbi:MAG: TIM barrel protein [Lapillicoccus sp.]